MKIKIKIVENDTNRVLVERDIDLVEQSDFSEYVKFAVDEARRKRAEPLNWRVDIKSI